MTTRIRTWLLISGLSALLIGSGAVESAAKHLVQDRMKRAGMRWSRDGGEALLALCAHLTNAHPRLRVA